MFIRKPPFQKQLSWLDSLTVEIQLNIGQQSQLPWLRPSYVYICDMTHPQSPIPSYIPAVDCSPLPRMCREAINLLRSKLMPSSTFLYMCHFAI